MTCIQPPCRNIDVQIDPGSGNRSRGGMSFQLAISAGIAPAVRISISSCPVVSVRWKKKTSALSTINDTVTTGKRSRGCDLESGSARQ